MAACGHFIQVINKDCLVKRIGIVTPPPHTHTQFHDFCKETTFHISLSQKNKIIHFQFYILHAKIKQPHKPNHAHLPRQPCCTVCPIECLFY